MQPGLPVPTPPSRPSKRQAGTSPNPRPGCSSGRCHTAVHTRPDLTRTQPDRPELRPTGGRAQLSKGHGQLIGPLAGHISSPRTRRTGDRHRVWHLAPRQEVVMLGPSAPSVIAARGQVMSIRLGGEVDGLAAGGGFVWAYVRDTGMLVRVSQRNGQVRRFPLGKWRGMPVVIAASSSAVWLADQHSPFPDLTRIDRTDRSGYCAAALAPRHRPDHRHEGRLRIAVGADARRHIRRLARAAAESENQHRRPNERSNPRY